jgi:hypothetical protein
MKGIDMRRCAAVLAVALAVICAAPGCGGGGSSSQTPQQRFVAEVRAAHGDVDVDTGQRLSDEDLLKAGEIVCNGIRQAKKLGMDYPTMIANDPDPTERQRATRMYHAAVTNLCPDAP